MDRWVNAPQRRAAASVVPTVPTLAAHRTNSLGRQVNSPRARLTRRLFIDLRRSAGSLCH
ncbi:hypothetical protein ACFZBU_13240 [Embleya sp. NPDC008237]|uniref:hypothetical protein n=1 Tax=Embleya sp. NPDC008237 TaxID=3363978 RepID=UPI0036F08631